MRSRRAAPTERAGAERGDTSIARPFRAPTLDGDSALNPVLKSFDLSGRTALITGSSAGIGYALARGLAGAGARVVLNARSADKLEQAAARLREEGATVFTAAFDVTSGEAVNPAIERIE